MTVNTVAALIATTLLATGAAGCKGRQRRAARTAPTATPSSTRPGTRTSAERYHGARDWRTPVARERFLAVMEPRELVRAVPCALLVLLAACPSSLQWAGASEVADPAARRIEIDAGREGFDPNEIRARVGEVITLNITRTGRDSCLERVIVHLSGERQIERELPLGTSTAITLQLTKPGELGLTCAKAGHTATIYVDPEVTR